MLKVEIRIVLQMGPQLDMLLPMAKQLMVVLASTELMAMIARNGSPCIGNSNDSGGNLAENGYTAGIV